MPQPDPPGSPDAARPAWWVPAGPYVFVLGACFGPVLMAARVAGGEGEEDVAADYGVPVEAVRACVEWVAEHPDGRET